MQKSFKKLIPIDKKRKLVSFFNTLTQKPKYDELSRKCLSKNTNEPRIILFSTPSYGNLGDHAITQAEVQFLNDNFPRIPIIEITFKQYLYSKKIIKNEVKKNDLIMINGGGFLGTLWPEAEEQVRDIIETFYENEIIIMPQTIYFESSTDGVNELKKSIDIYNSHKKLTVFLRDKNSFNFFRNNFTSEVNSHYVPDIVMYLNQSGFSLNGRNDVLFCLRKDKEKTNESLQIIDKLLNNFKKLNYKVKYTDTVIDKNFEGPEREIWLEKKWNEFGNSKIVVTDRLHGMIFSLITGTPCIALDNKSKKVSGVYEWIKNCGYIVCITEDSNLDQNDFEEKLNTLIKNSGYGYDVQKIRKNFQPVVESILKHFEGLQNE